MALEGLFIPLSSVAETLGGLHPTVGRVCFASADAILNLKARDGAQAFSSKSKWMHDLSRRERR